MYTPPTSDWDAGRYHRLSEPQAAWAQSILQRLQAAPGERILDLGCGTGRPTAAIAEAVGPAGFVAGADRSRAMLDEARRRLPRRVGLVQADGAALPFAGGFDAIFSGATFHWILDHDALFASLHAVLKPGGRLVAQCGGGPNLQRLLDRARAVMYSDEYAAFFGGWREPWEFADVATTRARLARAGFVDVRVSLDPAPTTLADAGTFREFVATVCVRHHVARLPGDRRDAFLQELTSRAGADDPPYTLDYWRLNIDARKAGHA